MADRFIALYYFHSVFVHVLLNSLLATSFFSALMAQIGLDKHDIHEQTHEQLM